MKETIVILGLLFIAFFTSAELAQAQEDSLERMNQRLEALEKANSKPQTQLKGYIQFNAAAYQLDEDIESEERADLQGGAHFRRLRYDARGALSGGFNYRLQLEFADEDLGLKNIHINYDLNNAQIRLGSTKVPQGHEYMTASSDIFFLERSIMTEAFKVGREAGLQLQGDINERFTYHTGVYTDATGKRDKDERAPLYTAVRLTGVIFENGPNMLHLGGHFVHSTAEKKPRFRAGPESRVSRIRPIDTGKLSDSHQVHRYGGELLALFSDWRFSYEYMSADVQDRDLSFSGHMVEAATNLTGEGRKYGHGSGTLKGLGKGLGPARPWSAGGFGALELALRASWIDLNDSPTPAQEVSGGEGVALAANLAWIPVKDVLFAAEVGRLDLEQVDDLADQEIGQFQLKAQVKF